MPRGSINYIGHRYTEKVSPYYQSNPLYATFVFITENEFKNKVRGMAVERGMTLEQVADAMGQSSANLYKKLANATLRY